jgi:hypothetical protein
MNTLISLGVLLAMLSRKPVLAGRDVQEVYPVGSGIALIGAPVRCTLEAPRHSLAPMQKLFGDLRRELEIGLWQQHPRPVP